MIVGALFGDVIEARVRTPLMVAVNLVIGGIGLIWVERIGRQNRDARSLSYGEALAIGVAQAAALAPGLSRSGATITVSMFSGLRRDTAARFVFLMSLPAVFAVAVKETLDLSEIGMAGIPVTLMLVGLAVSAIVGYVTVKYFVRYLCGALAGGVCVLPVRARSGDVCVVVGATRMMAWLRRSFLTGLVVTVPLFISVVTLVWVFRFVDRVATPLSLYVLGREVPGLGVLLTAAFILMAGAIATNVIGRRVLQRTEALLLNVPVFKTVYAPVKQLVAAFSPDNEAGFKKVVMVDDPKRGTVLGFLTKEFTSDRGRGPEPLIAVYVPTNHLYLGDVVICPRSAASFPDLSVEDGVRIFLTGGMALPSRIRTRTGHDGDETSL